jgi:ribokinase
MSKPIYVIGSANTDMVVRVKTLPLPGETVMGGAFFMNAGGKGANQAVAAARLGGQVIFISCLGDDVFGKESLAQLKKENISAEFIRIDTHYPSGVALIHVDDKGENSIVVAPGANSQLKPEQVNAALQSIQDSLSLVLLQLEIPMETVLYSIREAYKKGLRIILNPAPANNIPGEIFPLLHLITPNETEAEVLTGVPVRDESSAQKAADSLHRKGVSNVIITLGAKGALLSTVKNKKIIAPPKVTAVDTTAAGDCFNGAIAVALAEDKTLEEAVHFACRAASLSVTRSGAQASMPYLQEINAPVRLP